MNKIDNELALKHIQCFEVWCDSELVASYTKYGFTTLLSLTDFAALENNERSVEELLLDVNHVFRVHQSAKHMSIVWKKV
ncbi:MAG: hypothetical protein IPL34_20315 [Thiofilum sp.]|uniref:hypothetical protein n=1 Tax=Thiofilum sp. TaxID=2212733 RepID=UPI0025FF47EE|nr:hypothetical protein [Thiofilum sp.]MBK8455627.1 hypothetical protein [Thiofilum sp.]